MKLHYQQLGFTSKSTSFSPLYSFITSSSPGASQNVENTMLAENRIDDRDVASLLKQLKYILQLLALPIRAQVRLIEDDCTRIRQLSSAYRTVHLRVRREPVTPITADQMRVLNQLNTHLELLSHDYAQTLCSELAMRESSMWQKTRLIARDALIRFGWGLELPPLNLNHSVV